MSEVIERLSRNLMVASVLLIPLLLIEVVDVEVARIAGSVDGVVRYIYMVAFLSFAYVNRNDFSWIKRWYVRLAVVLAIALAATLGFVVAAMAVCVNYRFALGGGL